MDRVVKGQILISLDPGATVEQAKQFAAKHDIEFVRAMRVPDRFVFRIKQWQSVDMEQLTVAKVGDLVGVPGTRFVEANRYRIILDQSPNDPLYGQMWALKQIKAPQAWDFQKGVDGITICILDTSIEISHPDFQLPGGKSRMLTGYNADGNGTDPSPDPDWPFSHGTNCASLPCATTDNGLMISGLCWEGVKVYPIRATDNPFFFPFDLLQESYQRVKDYNLESGHPKVAVLSLSIGGNFKSQPEGDLLKAIRAQGTLIFAAAGNERPFLPAGYPATWPDVISVAATANGGGIASYSSFGDAGRTSSKVDLAAPGGDGFGVDQEMTLLEMVLRGATSTGVGTSYACPMAAGAAALLLSAGVGVDEVFDVLKQTADTHGLGVPNIDYGFGEINLFEALKNYGGSASFIVPKSGDVYEYRNIHIQARFNNILTDTIKLYDGDTELPYGDLIDKGSTKEIDTYHVFSNGTHTLSIGGTSSIDGKVVDPKPTVTFKVQPHTQISGTTMFAVPYGIGDSVPADLFGANFRLQRFVYQRDALGNALDAGNWYRYPDPLASFHPPTDFVTVDGLTDPIDPIGRAYFLTIDVATPLSVIDGANTSVSYRIPLNPGWQMFGNPFPFVIDWNTVEVDSINQRLTLQEAIDQEYVRPQIFRWSPIALGYTWRTNKDNGQIYAWEGAWVFARKRCWLVVHPIQTVGRAAGGDGRPNIAGDGWALRLSATAGGHSDVSNYIGATASPNPNYDIVPKAPSPMNDISLVIQSSDAKSALAQYLMDRNARKQEWTFTVSTAKGGEDVTLNWDVIVRPTTEMNYTLVDTINGRRVSMNATTSYRFQSSQDGVARKFKVIATPSGAAKLVVTAVIVSSSNSRGGSSFVVRYSLNKDAQVSVAVLSATGKRIATIADGGRAVGANTATWNGRDGAGIAQAPGVYMAEITATSSNGERVRVVSPIVLTR